jgi:hypothetical protein
VQSANLDGHRPPLQFDVALFDSQNGERVSIRAYLRNVAESKQVDFFPDTSFSMPQHH